MCFILIKKVKVLQFNCARYVGLNDVLEVESVESTGIRIADMFTGIISKLIKAIDNDLDYKSPEDSLKYTILSLGWFNLDEETFLLYKKLRKLFLSNIKHILSHSQVTIQTHLYTLLLFLRYIHEIKNLL